VQRRQKELEKGFNLHFGSKPSPKERLEAGARQLPLLAAKIRQELGDEDGDGVPVWAVLGRDSVVRQGGASEEVFEVGDEVEVRDKDMDDWRLGKVASLKPFKVMLSDWDQAFEWDFARWPEPKGKHAPKAPSAPRPFSGKQPRRFLARYVPSGTSDCSGISTDGSQTARERLPGGGVGGREAFSSRASSKEGRSVAPAASPGCEAPGSGGCWREETVEILAQDGGVVRTRPGVGQDRPANVRGGRGRSSSASRQGAVSSGAWEQHTVLMCGQNGDKLAIRPNGDRYDMPAWREFGDVGANMPSTGPAESSGLGTTLSTESWMLSDMSATQERARSRLRRPASGDGREEPRDGDWCTPVCRDDPSRLDDAGGTASWCLASLTQNSTLLGSKALPPRSRGSSLASDRTNPPPKADPDRRPSSEVTLPAVAASSPVVDQPEVDAFSASPLDLEAILRSGSNSSLGIDEILEMANLARQATPQGFTLEILRDALAAESRSEAGSTFEGDQTAPLRLPPARQADELAIRIQQLPKLWRGTILELIRQAEAVHRLSELSEEQEVFGATMC